MGCINHPAAPVAATCKRCKVELCGICARFLDSGEYCEKCAATVEADAARKSRERSQVEREMQAIEANSARIEEEEVRQKSRDKDLLFLRGGIAVGVLLLCTSLGLYAFPDLLKSDEQITQEQSIINQEACREVFQAIGIILSEGQTPDDTMRCPGTNIPNLVTRRGNTITVSHPNPRQFGLNEIYVSSDSHRVVMR